MKRPSWFFSLLGIISNKKNIANGEKWQGRSNAYSRSSPTGEVFNHQKRENEPLLQVKGTLFRYTWRKATPEVPNYITVNGVCNPVLQPFLFCMSKKPKKFTSGSACISANDTFLERRGLVWFLLFSVSVGGSNAMQLCSDFFHYSLEWSSWGMVCLRMRLFGYQTRGVKGIFSISNYVLTA